jgi:hypothetical protein
MYGQVIRRDEADNISTQGDPHNVYFRFDGKEIGNVGNVAPTDALSYVDSIAKRQAPPPDPNNYSFLYTGSPNPNPQRDIVNSFSQGAAGGRYTVQAGDTLQGIAQQVWGDQNKRHLRSSVPGSRKFLSYSPRFVISALPLFLPEA